MGALLWIARALILLLLLRFVLQLLFGSPRRTSRPGPGPAPQAPGERIGGELVRDPNCGTYIPKAKAIAVGAGAGVKYFCSAKCQQEFELQMKS